MQRGETIPKFTEQACYEIYQAPVCQRDTNEVSATAADAKDQISGIKDLPASQLTEGTSRPRRVL
jgi:hypothetical protein